MGDLRQFAKRMRLAGEAVETNAREITRRCAIAVDSQVVMATPVDTGRARANWRAALGMAPTDVLPEPASPQAGMAEALNQASQQFAAYRDGEIHIANNLPYIGALNDGHSSQAPAGFVESSVLVGVNAVRNAKGITGTLEMEVTESGAHAGAGTVARRNARRSARERLTVLDEEERGGN